MTLTLSRTYGQQSVELAKLVSMGDTRYLSIRDEHLFVLMLHTAFSRRNLLGLNYRRKRSVVRALMELLVLSIQHTSSSEPLSLPEQPSSSPLTFNSVQDSISSN